MAAVTGAYTDRSSSRPGSVTSPLTPSRSATRWARPISTGLPGWLMVFVARAPAARTRSSTGTAPAASCRRRCSASDSAATACTTRAPGVGSGRPAARAMAPVWW